MIASEKRPIGERMPYIMPRVTGSGSWASSSRTTAVPVNSAAPASSPASIAASPGMSAAEAKEAAWTAKVRAREEAWTNKVRAREEAWTRVGQFAPKKKPRLLRRIQKKVSIKNVLRVASHVDPQFIAAGLVTKSVKPKELAVSYGARAVVGLAIVNPGVVGAVGSGAAAIGKAGAKAATKLPGVLESIFGAPNDPGSGGGGGAPVGDEYGTADGEAPAGIPPAVLIGGGLVLLWLLLRKG